ncbi:MULTISPECIES: hypothetical protein [unclassified Streptomyces]|uniref:hypothetical protein n=1 Tax=unclassified Streptomyces TaxID=2593676 RepID=UPI002E33A9F2|nr:MULTISPECIES: hypothetical protein [unclassified Streptomyces]WUC69179.1 hypothetical protein OG861_33595 [Streptomyces sp. NBC_00539]
MSNSYTTLWTNDLCRELERSGYARQRLTMLFGGPHQSLPSFQRAGVQRGDRIYPVRVLRTRLHVLGAMEVSGIIPYEDAGSVLHDDDYAKLLDWRPLKAGCVTEVVTGPPGSPLSFGTAVPPDLLERLTYTSRRGERTLKYIEEGRLIRSVSLQGIYRLAPTSASELRQLVLDAEDCTMISTKLD